MSKSAYKCRAGKIDSLCVHRELGHYAEMHGCVFTNEMAYDLYTYI